jgi:hypothetical protein
MKALTAFLLVVVTLLLASCSKTQSPAIASSQPSNLPKWYALDQGDEYVRDFSLKAGDSKPIEIITDVPLFIGFKTDASAEVVKRYYKRTPQQVRLEVVGVKSSIGSVIGYGSEFPPVDAKLKFMAVNETDVSLRLVVFKKKSTSSIIWPSLKKSASKI